MILELARRSNEGEKERPAVTAEEMLAPVDFDWDAYQKLDYSPTLLDPLAVDDYSEHSFEIMVERLHDGMDETPLPAPIYREVIEEIKNEHIMRLDENEKRMVRIVTALQEFDEIPQDIARTVLAARSGQADVRQIAELLATIPEADGIEVMKATYPLNHDAMTAADTHFRIAMMQSFFPIRDAIRLTHCEQTMNTREASTFSYSNARVIRVYKTNEALITIGKAELELISRRSYLLPLMRTTTAPDVKNNLYYPIAMSKYLRLKR